MSAKYTFLAWDTPIENAPLKLALLQLANNADDNGFSYYSISKMAISCGMSEKTFQRKIAVMEKMGILTVERRANRPSLYTLVGDEMGVTLCHLQHLNATESLQLATESLLVSDRESPDPNNDPNNTPDISKKGVDYNKVVQIFNKHFCLGVDPVSGEKLFSSEVSRLTPKRKKLIDVFFNQTKLNLDKFEGYVHHVATNQSWLYLRKQNGRFSQRKFEFYMQLDKFVQASEEVNNE